MKGQHLFSGKNTKKKSLSSAELAKREEKVNVLISYLSKYGITVGHESSFKSSLRDMI